MLRNTPEKPVCVSVRSNGIQMNVVGVRVPSGPILRVSRRGGGGGGAFALPAVLFPPPQLNVDMSSSELLLFGFEWLMIWKHIYKMS